MTSAPSTSPLLDLERLRADFQGGGSVLRDWGTLVQRSREAEAEPMTRSTLAALAGVSVQTIARIEAGQLNPRDYTKIAIARALCVDAARLFPMPTHETVMRRFALRQATSVRRQR